MTVHLITFFFFQCLVTDSAITLHVCVLLWHDWEVTVCQRFMMSNSSVRGLICSVAHVIGFPSRARDCDTVREPVIQTEIFSKRPFCLFIYSWIYNTLFWCWKYACSEIKSIKQCTLFGGLHSNKQFLYKRSLLLITYC